MAAPTQGSTYEKIEIFNLDKSDSVDLRLGVTSFQYFEDLMSPVITAVMGITNTGNTINHEGIYNGLPLKGGEEVKIHITSPMEEHKEESPGIFEITMYVNKVTDYIQEKQKEVFTLHLVSKEGITNLNKRVIKKYKAKRIDEVIKDFLDIIECEYDDADIEKSSTVVNFIGNMRKPFSLVPSLASRAVPEGANSKTAGFFLWQTRTGIKFKSIETIIKNKEVAQEYTFNRKNEAMESAEASFAKILQYSVANNNDVMAAQKTGEYSTYRIYFNPYNFKFTQPNYSVFKPKNDKAQETLGTEESKVSEESDPDQIPGPSMAHRIISGVYSVGCLEENVDFKGTPVGIAATAINQETLEDSGQAISRYASIFKQVVTLSTPMNVELQAGDIIKCIFPQVSADDEVDTLQSGLYMIKELSHFTSANRSFTALKVIRDTPGV